MILSGDFPSTLATAQITRPSEWVLMSIDIISTGILKFAMGGVTTIVKVAYAILAEEALNDLSCFQRRSPVLNHVIALTIDASINLEFYTAISSEVPLL